MRRATGARVRAEGLTLVTREGPVYTGIDLVAPPGTLTVFQADSGGGRSALLLTLTGRMRPSEGTAHVDGHALPRQARKVRRISSLGLMDDVNSLDERLRVREHLSEGLLLRMRPAVRGLADEAMEAADLADLDRKTMVKDLTMLERRRFGVALALLAEPRLLAVDDVDGGLGTEHRADMWRTLGRLSEEGITVIAACAGSCELERATGRNVQGPFPVRQGSDDVSGPDPHRSEGPDGPGGGNGCGSSDGFPDHGEERENRDQA